MYKCGPSGLIRAKCRVSEMHAFSQIDLNVCSMINNLAKRYKKVSIICF